MGDRANLRIKYGRGTCINVYSHWGGRSLHKAAQRAVQRVIDSGRFGDEMYAARILISEIIPTEGDLNWGIGPYEAADAEHALIEVDVRNGRVAIYELAPRGAYEVYASTPSWSGTAEEYVALTYDPRHGVGVGEAAP